MKSQTSSTSISAPAVKQAELYADLITEESQRDVLFLLGAMHLLGLSQSADKVFRHLKAVRRLHPRALRRNMAREYLVLTIRHWASGTLEDWTSRLSTDVQEVRK